jgi:hypothetical protein
VLQESIEAVRLAEQRLDRVDGYLRAQLPAWSLFRIERDEVTSNRSRPFG